MDPRLTRIEEALVAAHNALALVSGLVTDYVGDQEPQHDESPSATCCDFPDPEPIMGGRSICRNCAATSG